jgi:hypothetical protein
MWRVGINEWVARGTARLYYTTHMSEPRIYGNVTTTPCLYVCIVFAHFNTICMPLEFIGS